jgi:hypothetical protein
MLGGTRSDRLKRLAPFQCLEITKGELCFHQENAASYRRLVRRGEPRRTGLDGFGSHIVDGLNGAYVQESVGLV